MCYFVYSLCVMMCVCRILIKITYLLIESSNVTLPLNVLCIWQCQCGRLFHGLRICNGCYGDCLIWYPATNIIILCNIIIRLSVPSIIDIKAVLAELCQKVTGVWVY